METIKNLLSGNIEKNDQVAHGSGRELGTTSTYQGLSGEGTHLAGAQNTSTGTTSVHQTSGHTRTSTGSTNPMARDAAVAASGVGLAEHKHRKHENERGIGSITTGHGVEKIQGLGNIQGPGYTSGATPETQLPLSTGAGHTGTTSGVGSSQVGDTQSAGYTSGTAIAGQSALSTATGHTGTNQGASYGGASVQGPHSTTTANRLDPNINTSGGTGRLEDAHKHSEKHGGGAEAADKHHSGETAATGAGAGVAAYEANKHHNKTGARDRDTLAGQSQPATGYSTTTTTAETGNHLKDHHVGRNAAIGAGAAGAASVAEHENHKRHSEYQPRGSSQNHDSATTSTAHSSTKDAGLLPGPAPHTAGPHKKDWMNKLDPRVDSHPYSATSDADILALPVRSGQGSFSEQTIDQDGKHLPRGEVGQEFAGSAGVGHSSAAGTTKDHHYGRDATVGAAAGGAAYEAEKHHKHDKDLSQAERDAKKEHRHDLKEEHRERKDSKSGLLGFLHRDKNKKYTPEEEAEFDRQEREHRASHHDRDAAVGAGAVGAAGVAEHEHNKSHSGPTPLAEKPKGKDIGDILHGVERNRGVPGTSGYAGTEGYGTGTGGALAVKEAPESGRSEATTDQAGAPLPLNADPELGARLAGHKKSDSGYAGGTNDYQSSSTLPGSTGLHADQPEIVRKQNPILGAMGITESRLTAPDHAPQNTTSGAVGSSTTQSDFVGSNTVAIGGSHFGDGHKGTTSGAVGSNTQSGFTGTGTTTSGGGQMGDGHNKLHKDPPPTQSGSGHVPASKSEREKLVNEGEEIIDKDSGVANSHAATGTSNY